MTQAVQTTADVRLANPDHFLTVFLDHLETHAHVERQSGGADITSDYGHVRLRRCRAGLSIEATAPTASELSVIRTFIADHVFEFAADAQIEWSGQGATDTVPANFQEVFVQRVEAVTPRMRRVVFRASRLSALLNSSHHHVRLLFPPEGRVPHWPRQSASGRLNWPGGDDVLSTRVYTIRWIDERTSTFAVDFVLHHEMMSGPGVAFAHRARPGAVVGLIGPGGGRAPTGEKLLLLGDETALPAIARIVESVAGHATIKAVVEVNDITETAYLCPMPSLQVDWLPRNGRPAGDPTIMLAALENHIGDETRDLTVWAGCEHGVAAELRARLSARLSNCIKTSIAAYWRRSATDALQDSGS
jgi:NADPH-dependent ferric siderophore reductase